MNVNGLKIDEQAIADGLYAIICEKGEEAIVACGMIPLWIMELSEKLLREKVVSIAGAQVKLTPKELDSTVQPIVSAIAIGIYRSASRESKMIV